MTCFQRAEYGRGGVNKVTHPEVNCALRLGSSVVTKAPPRVYVDGVTARYCAQVGVSGSSMDSPLNFSVRLKLF